MDSDCVLQETAVEGHVSGLSTGYLPYIFVKEQTDTTWSRGASAIVNQDSAWSAQVTVGTLNEEGNFFQIAVVAINDSQRNKIESDQCNQFSINSPIPLLITVRRDSIGDRQVGIYCETCPNRLSPNIDSFIGTYVGNGASIDTFLDDYSTYVEGSFSKKTTLSVNGSAGGYAGWFVQWGVEGTADSYSKDMSVFKSGKLSFWVKSTINLLVGIRSGNIPAGTENSDVLLTSYASFQPDSQWHQVCIPISDLISADPRTDLTKIKIFFNVASNTSSGGTGGVEETFWIDDVQWIRQCKPTGNCD
jgi:hypothetical protein